MKLNNNIRILAALLRKEVLLMRRNPIIPKMIIAMPVMVMLLLPLVATLDVKNVGIAVVDCDHSLLSRRLLADIDASEELVVSGLYGTHAEAIHSIEAGTADVILTIPPNWSRDMGPIDIEANGVNATKGSLGARYAADAVATTLTQWRAENGLEDTSAPITVNDMYNPTLNFKNFMIPALLVILLIIICGFLPALNLVSEKESGTIEAINVTPVGRMTFVLSKLIPFWIVGILVITVGMLIGRIVYGLQPTGSVCAIYVAAVLFSFIMSGLGVIVANRSTTMLQSIFMMFAIIIICQLMGGLFTPVSSMPQWAQIITYAIPPRYFNEIVRAIYLKGASVSDLIAQYSCLTLMATAVCSFAAITYRKRF